MEYLSRNQLTSSVRSISASLPSVIGLSSPLTWHRMLTGQGLSPLFSAPSAVKHYSSLLSPKTCMPLRAPASPRRQHPPLPAAFSVSSVRHYYYGYYEDSNRFKVPRSPINWGIKQVPQAHAFVIERFGKFARILTPGLHFLIPFVDRIAFVHPLHKQITIAIPDQSAITKDNSHVQINGVLSFQVVDPVKASYGIANPKYAIVQKAHTTMRSEIGKLSLDKTFEEMSTLNHKIVDTINNAAKSWGLECLSYEIKDIKVTAKVQYSMDKQVETERQKRCEILDAEAERQKQIIMSEGNRVAAINDAEAEKTKVVLAAEADKISAVLASEAAMMEQINKAKGEAEAILAVAEASAKRIEMESRALQGTKGLQAANLKVAEQWINAYSNVAKNANTILLAPSASDPMSAIVQAMSVYKNLNTATSSKNEAVSEVAEHSQPSM